MLIKELQSLCLDVRVLDENGDEIELKDDEDDYIPGTAAMRCPTSPTMMRSPAAASADMRSVTGRRRDDSARGRVRAMPVDDDGYDGRYLTKEEE